MTSLTFRSEQVSGSDEPFPFFCFSYSMTGKLGGHAGPVMTVLLRETNKESVVFTGSRDHYVKVCACEEYTVVRSVGQG